MRTFDLIAPFLAAILLYSVSPLLCRQVKRTIHAEIAEGRLHVNPAKEEDIPFYLAPPSISDYVEYAFDAVQVFPTLLLPVVGAIFGFSNGVTPVASVGFLVFVCILAAAMSAWITSKPSSEYVSRKWLGYSIMAIIGVVVNIAGIALSLIFR